MPDLQSIMMYWISLNSEGSNCTDCCRATPRYREAVQLVWLQSRRTHIIQTRHLLTAAVYTFMTSPLKLESGLKGTPRFSVRLRLGANELPPAERALLLFAYPDCNDHVLLVPGNEQYFNSWMCAEPF